MKCYMNYIWSAILCLADRRCDLLHIAKGWCNVQGATCVWSDSHYQTIEGRYVHCGASGWSKVSIIPKGEGGYFPCGKRGRDDLHGVRVGGSFLPRKSNIQYKAK